MSRARSKRSFPAAAAWILLALVCCAAAPPATQPATAPALTPADLSLLHQLETGTWHQRKDAEAALAREGPDALPTLRAMLGQTANPEAKARLSAIVDQLTDQVLVGPSRITMHEKNAPAASVYAELFRQADAPFETMPANLLDTLGPVSVDADHQPFWAVMQQLQKTTGVGMQRAQDGRCILMPNAPIAPGPQVMTDQFLVVLSRVRRISLAPGSLGAGRTFEADLTFYLEPKARIIPLSPQIKVEQATDDRGNVLAGAPEMNAPSAGPVPLDWAPVPLYFRLPEKDSGSRLDSLRLSLSVKIALHSKHIQIADITHAAAQMLDLNGIAVRFNGCSKKNNVYQLTLTSGPDPQAIVPRLVQDPQAAPRLLDAQGQTLTRVESGVAYHQTGNEITYMYMPSAVPQRLTWDIPTDVHTIDVPIDFRDLNLAVTRQ